MIPPPLTTKRKLKRISPLSAGKILGILYAGLGLLFMPFFLLMSFLTPAGTPGSQALGWVFGLGFALMAPIMYGAMGFIGGVISAFIYNVAAGWVGGIEVEVE